MQQLFFVLVSFNVHTGSSSAIVIAELLPVWTLKTWYANGPLSEAFCLTCRVFLQTAVVLCVLLYSGI